MPLLERDYMRRIAPKPPPWEEGGELGVVVALLLANGVVFLLQLLGPPGEQLTGFGVLQPRAVFQGQLWRLWTSTYLHSSPLHLLLNLLGLWFLGPPVERAWGGARFFAVYTVGGVLANVVLCLAAAGGWLPLATLALGASGSVLTIVGAAAALYPALEVLLFGLLPMTLRTFALVFGGIYLVNALGQGPNYGGDLAHLTGLIIGAGWARFGPW
ncbi:MAG: rhomboid family intramembrane serine protease [Planctomycetota bacterium]